MSPLKSDFKFSMKFAFVKPVKPTSIQKRKKKNI